MDDLASFLKQNVFLDRKKTMDKTYKQKSKEQKCNDFKENRKETRSTILLKKRNIANLSPFVTPEPSRQVQKAQDNKPKAANSNRLEMLKKWKAEKEKRKAEEKRRAKPIFKVCHVTEPVGKPNLESVNKEIKGRPIKPLPLKTFAPANHNFKPPNNVKPINLKSTDEKKETMVGKTVTRKDSVTNSQKVSRIVTRQTSASQKSPAKVLKATKSTAARKLTRQNAVSLDESQKAEVPAVQRKVTENLKVKRQPSKPQKVSKGPLTKQAAVEVAVVPKTPDAANGNSELEVIGDKQASRTEGHPTIDQKVGFVTPQRNSETEVIYSDEEITMKTPRQALSAKKGRTKGTPFPRVVISSTSSLEETPKRSHKKSSDTAKAGYSKKEVSERSKTSKRASKTSVAAARQRKDKSGCNDAVNWLIDEISGIQVSESSSPVSPAPKRSTPALKENPEKSPAYISPFVTISRGKDSARKEYKERQNTGGTYFTNAGSSRASLSGTSPQAAAAYFTNKLDDEISRIEGICNSWEAYKSDTDLPDEACDMINAVIGHSNLLITKKFSQFRSLIEECRSCQYKEKPISCQDLHGYWDTAYIQVEDLNKRFANLDRLKACNWVEVVPEKKVVQKRGRGRPKKNAASSKLKDFIKAARNKTKETDSSSSSDSLTQTNSSLKENSQLLTPVRQPIIPASTSTGRRSLRVSLLNGQMHKKRASCSPGLAMMRISQAIKCGDGLTPSKSILKTEGSRSEKRANKSVLFKDNIDMFEDDSLELQRSNKENSRDSGNISYASPVRTRKSVRHVL